MFPGPAGALSGYFASCSPFPRTTGMTGPLLREESLEPADERASFLAQGGCRSISDDLTIPFAGVLAYTFNAALRFRASP